ncbi:protein tramtrack, beta isoform isoform X4 [Pieris napi]|uniref:protein tramtrack, beta isoform isoform X4 n=1 Tax=Pieris napi TaxID=78633 RepID=UPI001FB9B2CD|nr:protein tramtrack, beta isoform isoform X4 [Pieris napi]
MATQRFCLRWNNHQSNMLSVFDQLLHAETFTDVTLAVDGQLLKAHKMVLSACSPYFQALFVNHQEKHPIVILKDVPYSDMKSLLDFMYRGEVSVDQERLTAFLKVAESLRIKGLTEVNEEKCDIPALTNSLIQQQTTAHTPPPQLHRIHPYMHQKRPASGIPSGGAPPNLLMPLLGNALMQPKRKRGRPRKLSGSSSDALNTAASPPGEFIPETASHVTNRAGDQLIRGSPEMLEVKMSMDGFNQDDGATSGGEDGGEALMIDEGDDAQSNEAPNSGKDSESAEYQTTYYDDVDSNFPVITLEVLSTEDTSENFTEHIETDENETQEAGVHFLSEVPNEAEKDGDNDETKDNLRYIGHIASRHSEDYSDSMPILTNNQAEIARETPVIQSTAVIKDEVDPEMSIPKTSVPNFQNQTPSIKIIRHIKLDNKKPDRLSNRGEILDKTSSEWEEQRLREEKLVADIIARVRKECEAKGDGAARKGYSRRTTVMHT